MEEQYGGRLFADRPALPLAEDELYLDRSFSSTACVDLRVPFRQGDVFVNSGAGDEEHPTMSAILMHPCTMREGVTLRPKVTVVEARFFGKYSKNLSRWVNGNYSQIPLPRLINSRHTYVVDLDTPAVRSSSTLKRTDRIATLADLGMIYFQHRVIFHSSRLAIGIKELAQANSGLTAELEMQRQWSDLSVSGDLVTEAEVEAAERVFDEFLSADDRRARLRDTRIGQPQVISEFNKRCLEIFGTLPL